MSALVCLQVVRMKTCSKCGVEKPVSEFTKELTSKDGYGHWCKECFKNYNQTPERKAYMRAYFQTPKMKAYRKAYAQTPERQAYYHSPKYKAFRKTPEQKAYAKAYQKAYLQTPERKASIARVKAKRRSKQKNGVYDLTADQWQQIVDQTPICPWCRLPFTESDPPTMDHIIPIDICGLHTAANIQALHKGCNSSKNDNIVWATVKVAKLLRSNSHILYRMTTK